MRALNAFERAVRLALSVILAYSALALFAHPAARVLAGAAAAFVLYEAVMARCPLHARMCGGAPTMPRESRYLLGLAAIQTILAYEWWSAGLSKLTNPEFVAGMPKTLAAFASKNPHEGYASFLTGFATQNATIFAEAVRWSQAGIAVTLLVCAVVMVMTKREEARRMAALVSVFALAGGALMNANFYFAAGWMSASTHSVNMVMFWMQCVMAYTLLATRFDSPTPVGNK